MRCDDAVMAKVTGKFQITLPKALVDRCGIRVGDELELRAIGRSIHIDRRTTTDGPHLQRDRLAHFDRATARQRARQRTGSPARPRSRGWTREELYARGRSR
jgi:AbrB family looped-hinge helix DNA binding protein